MHDSATKGPFKMMRQILGVALLALLLTAGSAVAQDYDEYGGDGSYFHFGFSGGLQVDDRSGATPPAQTKNDFLPGLGARVGGFATPHFAFEVAWDWGEGDVGYNVGSFNMRVLPFTGRLQPFVSAGFGFSVTDDVNPIWRAGGGLEYYLNDVWKIVLDGIYTKDIPSDGPLDVVTFGAMIGYHFY